LAVNRATGVGEVVGWTTTIYAIAGKMQENHWNGQDDSDITETSELFTIMPASLNRHILSAYYNWLRQGPANQPGSHLSASLKGREGS